MAPYLLHMTTYPTFTNAARHGCCEACSADAADEGYPLASVDVDGITTYLCMACLRGRQQFQQEVTHDR